MRRLGSLLRRGPGSEGSAGQILVIFAIGMVALFAMAALVIDAGGTLVERRKLQDVGDAAALAAANSIQTDDTVGCSLSPDLSTGVARAPRAEVVAAATAAVRVTFPSFPTSQITVYCPDGWQNFAVGVDLSTRTTAGFARVLGISGFTVGTTSQAVNGPVSSLGYSVVQLNPYVPSYATGRRGCPAVDFGGTASGEFQGSLYINSSCPASAGGAYDVTGSALVDLKKKSVVRMVGEATATSLTKTTPTGSVYTGLNALTDPLADPLAKFPLPLSAYRNDACPSGSPTTFYGSKCKIILSGTTAPYQLYPGIYDGGIEMRNQAVAYFNPGVYVFRGGGFAVTAGNQIFTVPTGTTTMSDGTWTSACLPATCGVLLYNMPSGGALGAITVQAGATLRMRPYNPDIDPFGAYMDPEAKPIYRNLLIWQDGSLSANDGRMPNTGKQMDLQLSGGGTVTMIGSIYTPKARVQLQGSAGGGGSAEAVALTVQFISWDLTFSGTSKFVFYYNSGDFSRPPEYGLIK